MQPSDLEFYTTNELVAELMRRKTFLGLVVHSEGDFRETTWKGEKVFKVRVSRNLDLAEAGRLLDIVAERMAQHDG
jgi:hypothetical protein